MKIAVWHNLPSGGGKRALFEHVRGLIDCGHHVEAWSPPTIDRTYLPLEILIRQHIVPLDDVPYRLTDKLQMSLQIDRKIVAMEEHSQRCTEEIAKGSFDILFANSCMFFASPFIGRYVDGPSLLYLQEPYRKFYEAIPGSFWAAPDARGVTASIKSKFVDMREIRNARVHVREEARNAKSFGRVLCNSYFSRESILRSYGLDAEVCYLGVDERHFQVGPADRAFFVVSLGSFTPLKNPQLCIETIAAMQEPRPALVWIANFIDPNHLAEMKSLASTLGVDLDVKFRVGDDELVNRLKTALAMIYTPRLEPFGLAPLEAGACATPVVATAEGGIRETISDGVNGLVRDADPKALAAALERLRDEPALARNIGEEGRRLAETKWSHEAATDRLISKLEAEVAA